MINKQLYSRLLRYCHHNEQGILVADEGYTSHHKLRFKKKLLTLKAVHFLMIHGFLPHGTLTEEGGGDRIVDTNFLTYKPYSTIQKH